MSYVDALRTTVDLERFALFAWTGLTHVRNERRTIEELRQPPASGRAPAMDALAAATRLGLLHSIEPFANEQHARGFPLLYELLVVRLWSTLEGLVDDIVIDQLTASADVLQSETVRKLRGPLVEFSALSRGERAEYLAGLLSQEVKAPLKPGVGRFEAVLAAVRMGGGVSPNVRRALAELSEVRNVVVHKGGRVDSKMLERCPWILTAIGDRVPLSPAHFTAYADAAQWYIIELNRRAGPLREFEAANLPHSLDLIESRIVHGWRSLYPSTESPVGD